MTEPTTTISPAVWNKSGWHWQETNANEFAIACVKSHLQSLSFLLSDSSTLKVSEVTKLTGDAFVNLRKGKKHYGFDLAGKCKFTVNDEQNTEGTWELPEIAADNEEVEVRVNVTKGNDNLREEIRKKARVEIKKQVDAFTVLFKEKF